MSVVQATRVWCFLRATRADSGAVTRGGGGCFPETLCVRPESSHNPSTQRPLPLHTRHTLRPPAAPPVAFPGDAFPERDQEEEKINTRNC